ncbi:MAG: gas vesicle protein K [Actinobacteria bacterium]|nr:gas vesicle protein K [Actinomycetota bacterium]
MSAIEPEHEPPTLVGLLDGLIDGGVHVAGDLVIGLADVELIRVALRLLVASEDTAQRTGVRRREGGRAMAAPTLAPSGGGESGSPETRTSAPVPGPRAPGSPGGRTQAAGRHPPTSIEERDREQLVRGVSQLVLTVVEVIHDLLERQAIRRVEAGTLTTDQTERLGVALAALEERMEDVKEAFGVTDDDLNLDLGPLGRLR